MNNSEIDFAAFELGAARLKLRSDIGFSFRQSRHGKSYLIEDEANSKFYRVGIPEYTFLSMLDGKTTIQSAIASTSAKLGHAAFSESEAARLCKWLIDAELAEKNRHDMQQWQETTERRKVSERMQWLNPIMLKIPIGNPDRFFSRLDGYLGAALNRWTLIAWLVMCMLGSLLAVISFDDLVNPPTPILDRNNWLYLGVSWILLRFIHETSHGLVCKKNGGRVREWGVLFLLMIPLPYVDVTSAWRFPDRRSRILTSAAGMMAELFLAAIACIIWFSSEDGLIRQTALNTMLAASLTTVIFNMNPLMRFDGYHILSDWLDAPNLSTHGRQYMRTKFRKLFYDLESGEPAWRSSQARLIRNYAIAATVWKVMIFVSLLLAALSLFDGIGLLIALVSAVLWVGVPAYKIIRFALLGAESEQPNRKRLALAVSGLGFLVIVGGLAIPAPTVLTSPAVIQPDPVTVVRGKSAGFLREWFITPGQRVSKGDALCRLENVDLISEVKQLGAQVQASDQRLRASQATLDPATARIEFENLQDLQNRFIEANELSDGLLVLAPSDGIVIASDLEARLGTYVQSGDEIVTVAGNNAQQAVSLVAQTDARSLEDLVGQPAEVRVWGSELGRISGTVKKVYPRVQTTLPHFSFAAPVGGDLAVQQSAEDSGDWILVKPHLQIEVALPQDAEFRSGQPAQVTIRAATGSLGGYLVTKVNRFFSDRVTRTHGL